MTIRNLLEDYLDKKTDAIQTIRTLTGIFDPDNAVDLLVIICQITRIEQGDIDAETFRSMYLGPV